MGLKMLERRRVAETMRVIGTAMQTVGQDFANALRDARMDESQEMRDLYSELSAQWGYGFIEMMMVLARKADMPVAGMEDWWDTYSGFHGKDWNEAHRGRFELLLHEYNEITGEAQAKIAHAEVTGEPMPGLEYFTKFIQAEHMEDTEEDGDDDNARV